MFSTQKSCLLGNNFTLSTIKLNKYKPIFDFIGKIIPEMSNNYMHVINDNLMVDN